MRSLRIFSTRDGHLVELDGVEIRDSEVTMKFKGGKCTATFTVPVDDVEVDVDVDSEDLAVRQGPHRLLVKQGQVFLDGRPVSAETFHITASPDGETGTVELGSVPFVFERMEDS